MNDDKSLRVSITTFFSFVFDELLREITCINEVLILCNFDDFTPDNKRVLIIDYYKTH